MEHKLEIEENERSYIYCQEHRRKIKKGGYYVKEMDIKYPGT